MASLRISRQFLFLAATFACVIGVHTGCGGGAAVGDAGPADSQADAGTGADASVEAAGETCQTSTDCPGSDGECAHRTCTDGICGTALQPDGFVIGTQVSGDCQQVVCDGQGAVKTVADSDDVPTDSNTCTRDSCSNGAPQHSPAPAGTSCGPGNQLTCDGSGSCTGCTRDADCGMATACTSFACNVSTGICATVYAPSGQGDPGGQTGGDCKKIVCNGSGGVATIEDDTDVPTSSNPCEEGACSTGTPSSTPVAGGTVCGVGATCDGAGTCSMCSSDADCGTDTACVSFACNHGACSTSYVPGGQGNPGGGLPGTCLKVTCDGQGGSMQVADDANLPNDGNPCTNDVCLDGVPSHAPTTVGASCGANLQCDGAGNCVGCLADSDCGTNTSCAAHLCQSGTCVTEDTPSGLACPDDGNPCTKDQCDGIGTCAHPTASFGSSCGAGQVCDDSGTCAAGCAIGGTFYAVEAANPVNACQLCTPATSTSAWSNQTNATACSDGNACTKGDACNAGNCTGTAYACTATACQASSTCDGNGGCSVVNKAAAVACPDDGNPCTGDLCDGSGACAHPASPVGTACGSLLMCNASAACISGCIIAGAVYDSGAANAANPCQTCDPSASTTTWTNIANGVRGCDGVCGSGKVVDTCGVCGGNNAEKGCDGVCNSGKVVDTCGVCGGNNAEKGCDGVCNSGKVVDTCGVCGGNNAEKGCDGVCNSGKVVDTCGVCGGNNAEKGCDGVCNSGKVFGCDGICGSGKVVSCGACGGCTAPSACGGGGTPGVCGCTPNANACSNQCAGTAPDGCGATIACHTSCGLQGACPCAGGHCSGNFCVCNPGPCD